MLVGVDEVGRADREESATVITEITVIEIRRLILIITQSVNKFGLFFKTILFILPSLLISITE